MQVGSGYVSLWPLQFSFGHFSWLVLICFIGLFKDLQNSCGLCFSKLNVYLEFPSAFIIQGRAVVNQSDWYSTLLEQFCECFIRCSWVSSWMAMVRSYMNLDLCHFFIWSGAVDVESQYQLGSTIFHMPLNCFHCVPTLPRLQPEALYFNYTCDRANNWGTNCPNRYPL